MTTAFFVDESMLATLTTTPVQARPDRFEADSASTPVDRHAPKRPGVYLDAGVVVDAVRSEGNETFIRLEEPGFRA